MKKTSISIVGSGNVGTHMAIALHAAGYHIHQLLSRSFDHAQTLAARVEAQPVSRPDQLDSHVGFCLLCVADDVLYDFALDLRLPQTVVAHTSGTTPASVLKRISRHHGVMWSPQTFVRDIAMDYTRLPLCIEGSTPTALKTVEEVASSISPCIYHLTLDQRRIAHLGAVLVSNFTNAINASAQELMDAAGLDFAMLRPLAEQTLHKWDFGNLWAQQTGPARRGDTKTLDAQRRLLAHNPQLLDLYDRLTELIQSR